MKGLGQNFFYLANKGKTLSKVLWYTDIYVIHKKGASNS